MENKTIKISDILSAQYCHGHMIILKKAATLPHPFSSEEEIIDISKSSPVKLSDSFVIDLFCSRNSGKIKVY